MIKQELGNAWKVDNSTDPAKMAGFLILIGTFSAFSKPIYRVRLNIMKVEDRQIVEFQRIYEEHFGEKISSKEALEKGFAVIRLVKAIYELEYENAEHKRRQI
ncbi:MAG: hypothetical protein A2119_02425 [Candidatus Colwellbacteria bacterium GWA2_46_10]|uniref:Uncharacterized protein n=2 Tax=Parcubacteria group TaxID=1794811 RepID=A0A1G1YX62_9BACT|nr:MAG: hypothetical protein A2119_02425 [Candidatus Colwellbacteria bacterium GWA2_46_10]